VLAASAAFVLELTGVTRPRVAGEGWAGFVEFLAILAVFATLGRYSAEVLFGSVGDALRAGVSDALTSLANRRGFMAAAKVQSMQSLSMWWGDSQGATRDLIAKDELEKRELIMLRCLKHDRYDVVGDALGTGGTRDVIVNVKYHDSENTTHLTVVAGPHSRWYVQNVDLKPLQSICIA